MSTFGETVFPQLGTFNASSSNFSNPILITTTFPDLILQGTESNGGTVAITEVIGDCWITTNALFDGSVWRPVNPALAPSALVVRNNSTSVDALTGVAGANPITWGSGSSGITSPGYITLFGGLKIQWGTLTVHTDNASLTTVNFPVAYSTAVFNITTQWSANVAEVVVLQVQPSPSLSSFQVAGLGGGAGETASAYWFSIGK